MTYNKRSGGRPSGKFRGGRGGSRGRGGRGGGRKQPTFDPSQFINKNPVEQKEDVYEPKHTFADFGFNPKMQESLDTMGIVIPSPIQDQAIPEMLAGNDVVGLAETGTGKTAAFLLPLIEKTAKGTMRQTLILAPTRELAIQIDTEFKKLSRGMRQFSTVCVGGTPIYPQIRGLKRTNHFIIGTPGRVIDLIDRGAFDVTSVTAVVLDEADRMLDMGFVSDMRKIIEDIPDTRETHLFSATMNTEAEKLVKDFLKNPVTISVKKKDVTNSIEQDVITYRHTHKYEELKNLLTKPECSRVIVFGAMKHSVEKLSRQLTDDGIKSESIHGNKDHKQRQRALRNFKEGNAYVLVATDVAARGIHVDDVSHVVNYDLPNTFADYVHRIGRTGRGNKKGKALTFVSEDAMKTPQRGSGAGSKSRSGAGGPRKSGGSRPPRRNGGGGGSARRRSYSTKKK